VEDHLHARDRECAVDLGGDTHGAQLDRGFPGEAICSRGPTMRRSCAEVDPMSAQMASAIRMKRMSRPMRGPLFGEPRNASAYSF
jgi:hypothetical protein